MDIIKILGEEFDLKREYSENIVSLIDEGCTIPFIARYRKEMHGSTDDQVLREFADRLKYLRNLEERKAEVKNSIITQEKWTDEIGVALDNAVTMTEVEDIYRPYKKKRKTRAMMAIERGLEPLATLIMSENVDGNINEIAATYIDADKKIVTSEDALAGASDIIAERISDDASLRKTLRDILTKHGVIKTKLDKDNEKSGTYSMYDEYEEKVASIPSHRILAINRGEKEDCLKVGISVDRDMTVGAITKVYVHRASSVRDILIGAISDSYDRLIFPSIEREVRGELTDKANEQAIKMFEVNLEPLLMQPPLKGKTILGLDPAYRTGCKLAVIDTNGDVLDTGVVFPTIESDKKREEGKRIVLDLIKKYNIDVISIGNGTASKESEIFVVDVIKSASRPVQYMVVNEAGASVYSASKLGAEEFPDFDVSKRSAVSIARRLQDPLAELIKIDVKSIGVGQYQHDMPEKRLTEVLDGVVEDCVNKVGVDLTTASYSLLSHVAGLNTGIAKNIVAYRTENGIDTKKDLLKVSKLGPKAFEQCAGFLRIPDGNSVFDNTGIHPESYKAAETLLEMFDYEADDVVNGKLDELKTRVEKNGVAKTAEQCGVGAPTLMDIVDELMKPGRDVRDSLPQPVLRDDLMDIKDLSVGMELSGVVRNVIDFGVFVDIGVHQDGLVHISEIADGYIKHPSEVLKVGDNVKVKVIGVDVDKKRISLSMKTSDNVRGLKAKSDVKRDTTNIKNNKNNNRNNNRNNKKSGASLDDMLAMLKNKYSK